MADKISTTIRIEAEKYKDLKRAMLDNDVKSLQTLIDLWIDEYLREWQLSGKP
ncbi:hypothetical protein HF883_10140 [Cloacibacillus porcorum]|uniref:hypothetical protein n=1 Tax=Cloacibacillus porcorum TaxID=1197717 RepID=UPI001459C33B|nr:hypothetical protein [Cloacibacillus porcorum]NMF18580.1 hypothetical protein [Cloacibacillus porcorum]